MSNKRSKKSDKITVVVTEEEFNADLAAGLDEDEVLPPGRHSFQRGSFLKRQGIDSGQVALPAKVRISINLDQDIVTYFKERAARPNAAPYQTQINNTLREFMERDQMMDSETLPIPAQELLADPRFIDAVAERVLSRKAASKNG